MKLRSRVLLLLGMTLVGLVAGISLLSYRLLLRSYTNLEQQKSTRNLERIRGSFQQAIDDLHEKSFDWANFDDTYRFMADHNKSYIAANLTDTALQGMHLDAILYVDTHRRIFHAKTVRRFPGIAPPVPDQILAALPLDASRAGAGGQPGELSGIARMPESPMLVSVRPIHTSLNKGKSHGWIIFGRYFTAMEAKQISDRMRVDLRFLRVDTPDLRADYRKIADSLSPARPARLVIADDRTMHGFIMQNDLQGRPLMLIVSRHNRDIYQQGLASVRHLLLIIVVASLIFSVIVLFILERCVLQRVAVISQQVAGISDFQRPLPRLDLPGKDELTGLAGKINTMLAALEENAMRLRSSEEQIRAYSESLEQTVAARTRDLRAANSVLENALDGIARLDAEGRYASANAACAALFGCAPETLEGTHWTSSIHPGDHNRIQETLSAALQGKSETEARGIRPDGSSITLQIVFLPAFTEAGAPDGFYCFLKDVTERKRLEAQITHQAFHDPLTDLPNRTLFAQNLVGALARARRERTISAVLFLDLDNFKVVNDSMGHETGDGLLMAVARRLEECVRPGDTVARLGGDEFALLLEGLAAPDEACIVAERILAGLRLPIKLPTQEVFASASIGIACAENADHEPEILLRDADTAMYYAKASGKSSWALFEPSMNASAVERMEIETGLRHALERNEFRVHYQPLIDLVSGRMVGTEALIRWQHPTRDLVPPGQFIPVAEATGMIVPIGYWVLEEACRQTKQWQEQQQGGALLTVNVNLSTQQLHQDNVVEQVAAILKKTGLPPASLKLEITESGLMEDMQNAVARLHRLKALGIKLAIDDFGTGYSSMSYLSDLPVNTVKIDRAFISRLEDCEEANNVVSAIVLLARALQLDVTAEGIETEGQVALLQGHGCDIGQGYYFARPASGSDFHAHLTAKAGTFIKVRDEADANLIEKLLSELSHDGKMAA